MKSLFDRRKTRGSTNENVAERAIPYERTVSGRSPVAVDTIGGSSGMMNGAGGGGGNAQYQQYQQGGSSRQVSCEPRVVPISA